MKKHNYFSFTRSLTCTLALFTLLLVHDMAYAQEPCGDLLKNEEWTRGIDEIVQKLGTGQDLDSARIRSKELFEICSQSPTLNYLTGRLAEERKNMVDALYYYQKASEYTYVFAVEPELAKEIWYKRYLAENPDLSAEEVDGLKQKIDEQTKELARLRRADENYSAMRETKAFEDTVLMWTGAGTGLVGLAVAGAGVGLVLKSKEAPCDIKLVSEKTETKATRVQSDVKSSYLAGWALVGAGGALAVTGAILAGVYGYRVSHQNGDSDFSFQVSPVGAAFNMTF